MICLLALVVFGILGIFSAYHRKLALEAFDCVFRRITLRKCESGLDQRLKSQITGKLLTKSPVLARFTFKNFELISWIFTILMIASLIYSGISIYNYISYGNCYGKPSESFCIFDPTGKTKASSFDNGYEGEFIYPTVDDDPSLGNPNASITIIEFGCFRCHYTKNAEPIIKQILQEYSDKVFYVYRDFPLNEKHAEADIHAEAADCALEQGKYWEYHDLLFEHQEMQNHTETIKQLAADLNLNTTQFNVCFDSRKYRDEVYHDFEDGVKAEVQGTPTFFINGEIVTGPHDFNYFKKIIDKKLKESN